jgi:hypothetical protein
MTEFMPKDCRSWIRGEYIYRYIDTSIKKEQIKVKTAALLTAAVILTAGMIPQQAYAAETAAQITQLANPW